MKQKAQTKLIVFSLLLLLSINSQSQNKNIKNYPEVGKPCPDFILKDIKHFNKKQVSVSDFNDKWLIVDFFTAGCSTCFASFPKLNKLAKEFEEKVQFILVGKEDGKIKSMYEKYRQHFNLDLAVTFDKEIFKQFGIHAVPYIVWIDPQGVVRAITGKVTNKHLQMFLDGKDPFLSTSLNAYQKEKEGDKLYGWLNKPLFVEGNGGDGNSILYRSGSILAKWKGVLGPSGGSFLERRDNMLQSTAISLSRLYRLAYADTTNFENPPNFDKRRPNTYGEWWLHPVLEVSNTKPFHAEYITKTNLYNYSLIVPNEKVNEQYMQKLMQRDLQNYFGYDVKVETRKMPCWRIVTTKKIKRLQKTKGGDPFKGSFSNTGISVKNLSIDMLIGIIWGYHQREPPFINATGIDFNIDIEFDAIFDDLTDIKRALQENGLDLVKGEKEMNVIVIRDPINK